MTSARPTPRRSGSILAATIAIGVLTGACVANPTASGGAIGVTSTDDACTVSTTTTPSGTVAFDVANKGSKVTEFYLMADDGLRIVAEVENIAPGTSRALSATSSPGPT